MINVKCVSCGQESTRGGYPGQGFQCNTCGDWNSYEEAATGEPVTLLHDYLVQYNNAGCPDAVTVVAEDREDAIEKVIADGHCTREEIREACLSESTEPVLPRALDPVGEAVEITKKQVISLLDEEIENISKAYEELEDKELHFAADSLMDKKSALKNFRRKLQEIELFEKGD